MWFGIFQNNKKKNVSSWKVYQRKIQQFLSSQNQILLLAEEDNQVIGYLAGSFYKKDYKHGHIDDLFVSKKYRRNGIASELIKKFVKILKDMKIKTLCLDVSPKNKTAYRLYKKLGFGLAHYEMEKIFK